MNRRGQRGPLDWGELWDERENARMDKTRVKAICIGLVIFWLILLSLPYWP